MGKFFTEREIRAVAVFLPLAGLLVLGLLLVRPKADPAAALRAEAEMEERADTVVMRPFDPNTVDYDGLRRLGLTKHEAVSLLKYRARRMRCFCPSLISEKSRRARSHA